LVDIDTGFILEVVNDAVFEEGINCWGKTGNLTDI
jgi:hypothetical protein